MWDLVPWSGLEPRVPSAGNAILATESLGKSLPIILIVTNDGFLAQALNMTRYFKAALFSLLHHEGIQLESI